MSDLNIQFENEQSIHNNSQIRSNDRLNLKRKQTKQETKTGRKLHEIRNYFHNNRLNTRLICNLCEASYEIKTQVTNLKNHFERDHKNEYQKFLQKKIESQNEQNQKRKKDLINSNQKEIQEYFPPENFKAITNKHVQISEDYETEEEIEEVIANGVIPIQSFSIKKEKNSFFDYINNIEANEIELNDETIKFKKCKIIFNNH
jgi:hypothetical protein